MAFPTGWGRRATVTIGPAQVSGAGALSDFPFVCTVDNLPSEMFDADGSNPALAGGGDIRFSSDEAGSNQLSIDVRSFTIDNDPANGTAEIFVKASSINDSDVFYVWYDKTGETQPAVGAAFGRNSVWTDYTAVYHFEEAVNNDVGGYIDSTGSHDASGVSMSQAARDGQWAGLAQSFDGSADYINMPSGIYSNENNMTVQAWSDIDDLTTQQRLIAIWGTSSSDQVMVIWMSTTGAGDGWRAQWKNGGGTAFNVGAEDDNDAAASWQKLALTVDPSNVRLNLDGTEKDSIAFSGNATGKSPTTFRIGRLHTNSGDGNFFDGGIDEVRIRPSTLSADWLATEYNSENAPGTFATAGTPETPGGPTGRIMSSLAASGGLAYKGGIAGSGGGLAG